MRALALALALPLALSLAACGDKEDDDTGTPDDTNVEPDPTTDTPDPTVPDPDPTVPAEDTTIVGVAAAAGDFTTLLAAVDAAGLTETLQGPGPFTVFAPTDAAFAALPAGTVDALLADIPTLTDILLYHVVAAELDASAVVSETLITTLQGADLSVSTDGGVFVGGVAVVVTDIQASNGIIHVVDAVIIPPATIGQYVKAAPDFSTLYAGLDAAGLVSTLDGPGPFTVFAPTNAAFEALPPGALDGLLNDIPALTEVLLYHVAGERLTAEDVLAASSVTTLQGGEASIRVNAEGAFIDQAQIVVTDVPAGNGTIHVIDAVLMP